MSTDVDVRDMVHGIQNRNPPSLRSFDAVFYGVHCTKRHIVQVPLDRGVYQLESIDDLDTQHWVSLPPYDDIGVVNLDQGRHLITHFPGSTVPLRTPFTIYAVNQRLATESHNRPISHLLPRGCGYWRGPVLVIKSNKLGKPVNVHICDLELVDLLVKSAIMEQSFANQYVCTGHLH